MLCYVLLHTYQIICEQYNESNSINDVDIIAKVEHDFEQVCKQYNQRSTEKFEMYYKNNS